MFFVAMLSSYGQSLVYDMCAVTGPCRLFVILPSVYGSRVRGHSNNFSNEGVPCCGGGGLCQQSLHTFQSHALAIYALLVGCQLFFRTTPTKKRGHRNFEKETKHGTMSRTTCAREVPRWGCRFLGLAFGFRTKGTASTVVARQGMQQPRSKTLPLSRNGALTYPQLRCALACRRVELPFRYILFPKIQTVRMQRINM